MCFPPGTGLWAGAPAGTLGEGWSYAIDAKGGLTITFAKGKSFVFDSSGALVQPVPGSEAMANTTILWGVIHAQAAIRTGSCAFTVQRITTGTSRTASPRPSARYRR